MNSFIIQNKAGNSIYLEWKKIQGQTPELTQKVHSLADILTQTYTKQELGFAQTHPSAITKDYFLNPLAPLFEVNIVDWEIVREQIKAIFNRFFTQTDFAQYSSASEINYFVIAKNTAGELLGFIQFISKPEFPQGTIKAGLLGINVDDLQPELREILMSSIFRIVPETKRIIIHNRVTNKDLLDLYNKWGFKHSIDGYWVNSEYMITDSKTLQDTATI